MPFCVSADIILIRRSLLKVSDVVHVKALPINKREYSKLLLSRLPTLRKGRAKDFGSRVRGRVGRAAGKIWYGAPTLRCSSNSREEPWKNVPICGGNHE